MASLNSQECPRIELLVTMIMWETATIRFKANKISGYQILIFAIL